jgi:hypothetical protein
MPITSAIYFFWLEDRLSFIAAARLFVVFFKVSSSRIFCQYKQISMATYKMCVSFNLFSVFANLLYCFFCSHLNSPIFPLNVPIGLSLGPQFACPHGYGIPAMGAESVWCCIFPMLENFWPCPISHIRLIFLPETLLISSKPLFDYYI